MKPTSPHRLGRRTVLFWLRLLVGLGVLGLIVRRIGPGAAIVRPGPLLFAAVAAATGLLFMSQAVAALRWKIVLGEDALPWSYLCRLYLIGSFLYLACNLLVGITGGILFVASGMTLARTGEAAGVDMAG